jgi:hypothetical protein
VGDAFAAMDSVLCADPDLSSSVSYLCLGDSSPADRFTLTGILQRRAAELLGRDGVPIAGVEVVLFARLADWPSGREPRQGDTLIHGDLQYTVAEVQPDAIGGVHLRLTGRVAAP